MHGLVVALGRAAPHLTHQAVAEILGDVPRDGVHLFADGEGVSVAVLAPPIPGAAPPFTWAPHGRLGLALGGYLLLDSPVAVAQHANRLLEAVELRGLEGALRDVVMGSFNLAIIDLARGEVMIANDRMGSIPLDYAEVPGGVIVTSVPALLGLGRLVPREIDWTACAEMLYVGHTLGDRTVVAHAARLRPATMLRWSARSGSLETVPTKLSPTCLEPDPGRADVDGIGDRIEEACRRHARLGGHSALFLSGGMDSRLLLAAWPRDETLPWYSYGPADYVDVVVARIVAAHHGAPHTHVPLPGDGVAAGFREMARFAGVPVFPNRYIAARRVRDDGFHNVVDGYMGDAVLGGRYYKFQRYLSRTAGYLERGDVFVDWPVARVGLDAITRAVLVEGIDPDAGGWAARYLHPDIAARLAVEGDSVRHEVWREVRLHASAHESAALVLRDLRLNNRNRHGLASQGGIASRFARVYYPFVCDVPLLEALFRVRPRDAAFRRLQLRLFRRRYPSYAALPFAASRLPLRRSSRFHRWAAFLQGLGLSVGTALPELAGAGGVYDEWDEWLRESAALRALAVDLLVKLGFAEPAQIRVKMNEIASGQERGAGELLHLAGLAHLLEAPTARDA
jgi:Asparagine synthase/Glutamine amidotransferase domain